MTLDPLAALLRGDGLDSLAKLLLEAFLAIQKRTGISFTSKGSGVPFLAVTMTGLLEASA